MKHSESTSRTRQSFAASLKKLASIQPLSKVTVSALFDDIGFNRNTFYYHFRDIYDLLHWTLEQEASVVHGAALADPYSACTVADKALNGDERCSCFWDHIGVHPVNRTVKYYKIFSGSSFPSCCLFSCRNIIHCILF